MNRKQILSEIDHLFKQNYEIVFTEAEEGGYNVSVPELPGCFTQGDTYDEALKNAGEAIRVYIYGELQHFYKQNFNHFTIENSKASDVKTGNEIKKELSFG
ncbi:MAG: hypothetical protein A2Y33_08645 [Spirochaetes bacterium GWF1_51_8]|nr:MAG: hypothetical protein A2Y33_08645 [Spirochaetes bacterium GWF1_51_8]